MEITQKGGERFVLGNTITERASATKKQRHCSCTALLFFILSFVTDFKLRKMILKTEYWVNDFFVDKFDLRSFFFELLVFLCSAPL